MASFIAAAAAADDAGSGSAGAAGGGAAAALAPGGCSTQVLRFKGKPVTCMALSADAKYVFCGSKCGTIVQWSLATGEKLVEYERAEEIESTKRQGGGKVYERHGNDSHGVQGHTAEVLALAITSDGKMLASGKLTPLLSRYHFALLSFLPIMPIYTKKRWFNYTYIHTYIYLYACIKIHVCVCVRVCGMRAALYIFWKK